jgi:hypothetical protein
MYRMSLKSETTVLRICGNCVYASRRIEFREIQKMKRMVHPKQQYRVLLRRYVNSLDAKVHCRMEDIRVGLLDEACAFWRSHRQRSHF